MENSEFQGSRAQAKRNSVMKPEVPTSPDDSASPQDVMQAAEQEPRQNRHPKKPEFPGKKEQSTHIRETYTEQDLEMLLALYMDGDELAFSEESYRKPLSLIVREIDQVFTKRLGLSRDKVNRFYSQSIQPIAERIVKLGKESAGSARSERRQSEINAAYTDLLNVVQEFVRSQRLPGQHEPLSREEENLAKYSNYSLRREGFTPEEKTGKGAESLAAENADPELSNESEATSVSDGQSVGNRVPAETNNKKRKREFAKNRNRFKSGGAQLVADEAESDSLWGGASGEVQEDEVSREIEKQRRESERTAIWEELSELGDELERRFDRLGSDLELLWEQLPTTEQDRLEGVRDRFYQLQEGQRRRLEQIHEETLGEPPNLIRSGFIHAEARANDLFSQIRTAHEESVTELDSADDTPPAPGTAIAPLSDQVESGTAEAEESSSAERMSAHETFVAARKKKAEKEEEYLRALEEYHNANWGLGSRERWKRIFKSRNELPPEIVEKKQAMHEAVVAQRQASEALLEEKVAALRERANSGEMTQKEIDHQTALLKRYAIKLSHYSVLHTLNQQVGLQEHGVREALPEGQDGRFHRVMERVKNNRGLIRYGGVTVIGGVTAMTGGATAAAGYLARFAAGAGLAAGMTRWFSPGWDQQVDAARTERDAAVTEEKLTEYGKQLRDVENLTQAEVAVIHDDLLHLYSQVGAAERERVRKLIALAVVSGLAGRSLADMGMDTFFAADVPSVPERGGESDFSVVEGVEENAPERGIWPADELDLHPEQTPSETLPTEETGGPMSLRPDWDTLHDGLERSAPETLESYTLQSGDNYWDIAEGQTAAGTLPIMDEIPADKMQQLIKLGEIKMLNDPTALHAVFGPNVEDPSMIYVDERVNMQAMEQMLRDIAVERGWVDGVNPATPDVSASVETEIASTAPVEAPELPTRPMGDSPVMGGEIEPTDTQPVSSPEGRDNFGVATNVETTARGIALPESTIEHLREQPVGYSEELAQQVFAEETNPVVALQEANMDTLRVITGERPPLFGMFGSSGKTEAFYEAVKDVKVEDINTTSAVNPVWQELLEKPAVEEDTLKRLNQAINEWRDDRFAINEKTTLKDLLARVTLVKYGRNIA